MLLMVLEKKEKKKKKDNFLFVIQRRIMCVLQMLKTKNQDRIINLKKKRMIKYKNIQKLSRPFFFFFSDIPKT